ncbi:helix-turn-helix domain-containing protein [Rhizobium sp. PEPV16]|uniref:winged helix-turn-helix transcriptional regulator n=1 Tax=Rhizobium sp. PEPV16 TaxID=1820614 RepID=UPI0024849313|nr:helix-turn-helix domain-containing protein [Rhizobium sp. PEPV16]
MDGLKTQCGLDVSLSVIGGKWKPLVLYHLRDGPTRFSEIRRRVGGISEKGADPAASGVGRNERSCTPRSPTGASGGRLCADTVR